MSKKIVLLRVSLQEPAFKGIVPWVATCFLEYDGAKVLKAAPGGTDIEAVNWLAEKVAAFCDLPSAEVKRLLRQRLLPDVANFEIPAQIDDDDIPF